MNRELIYAGLYAQLSGIAGFNTASRLLRHWVDVPPVNQPAIFQAQGKETAITVTGQPTKWELRLSIYLYARGDGLTPPSSVLNPLLDAVCNAINARSPVTNTNLLSAVIPGVAWARIDGTIETDEGTLGDQTVAIIPVLIFATD